MNFNLSVCVCVYFSRFQIFYLLSNIRFYFHFLSNIFFIKYIFYQFLKKNLINI